MVTKVWDIVVLFYIILLYYMFNTLCFHICTCHSTCPPEYPAYFILCHSMSIFLIYFHQKKWILPPCLLVKSPLWVGEASRMIFHRSFIYSHRFSWCFHYSPFTLPLYDVSIFFPTIFPHPHYMSVFLQHTHIIPYLLLTYIYMYIYVYIGECVSNICLYIYMFIYICMYMYMYIYIHMCSFVSTLF